MATSVKSFRLPSIDREALAREDAINDAGKDRPYRFAVPHAVAWNPANAGIWSTLPNGDRLWQMEIQSPGAVSLNVIFDRFRLKPGAEVYLYSADRAHVLGPLTHLNNLPAGNLPTMLLEGDHMVVEYLVPKSAEEGELSIGQVAHGYRGLGESDFGNSGMCNNDPICPEWTDWSCHTRSVVLTMQSGRTWCTGTLLNNTSQDGRPLVLTANHCGPQNIDNWVFVFNWTSPTCNPATNAPRNQSISGGELLVRNSSSDFGLLEMSSKPPADYEVYYSGWDASGRNPQSQVGIHHPSGDIMKISLDSDPARESDNYWSVVWNDGTTEPGSSGSGLWDENQRLIGQLLGGGASCSNTGASDQYGMLAVSWGLGADRYLDPGNTGQKVMDGMGIGGECGGNFVNASFNPDLSQSCEGAISFGDKSSNAKQWQWDFGDGSTSTEQNPSHIYSAAGTYTVKLVVQGDSGKADTAESQVKVSTMGNIQVTGDTSCIGQSAQLSATAPAGTKVSWYGDAAGETPLATGTSFTTPELTGPVTYYVQASEDKPSGNAGPESNAIGGGNMFSTNFDHGLFFDAIEPITLKSVKVYAGSAGSRKIEVRKDRVGEAVATATRDIPEGESRVELNLSLDAGSYFITVAEGPVLDLYRNNSGAQFPYTVDGLVTITRSSAEGGYYYFFYDWEVQEQGCTSSRIAVPIQVNPANTCHTDIVRAGGAGAFTLRPTGDVGVFMVISSLKTEVRIYHASGKLQRTLSIRPGSNRLDLRDLAPGMYMATFTGDIAPRWMKVGF